jgi:hypothetical protein
MKRALLFVVCGAAFATGQQRSEAIEATRGGSIVASQVAAVDDPFQVRPLNLSLWPQVGWRRAGPFTQQSPEPGMGPMARGLTNPRTGVTCTMRILPMEKNPDPGIVRQSEGTVPDDIVRNSASPCLR